MYKRILLVVILAVPCNAFAQRFSQYFTNTLFESFENPAQGAFKPDSSKIVAFNFFIPNFNINANLTGNGVRTVKQAIFLDKTSTPGLSFGQGRFNYMVTNANVYLGMLKFFTSLDGKQEIGFSEQIKGEGRALVSDETFALFDGGSRFRNGNYSGLFNDKYQFQSYHQLSFTYRESLNKQFSFGMKFSLLSGIVYDETNITRSSVTFDRDAEIGVDQTYITLGGTSRRSYDPGDFGTSNLIPTFKHPGLSVSFGLEQHNEDGVHIQYNLKDLGFIHWNSQSNAYNFFNTATLQSTDGSFSGKDIYDASNAIFQQGGTKSSFNTVTDGRFEVSATKYYQVGDNRSLKYNPVVVLSKQLFYSGFTGALINNLQYNKFTVGLTTTYDDLKQFNLGGQVMFKANNAEFFIGTEQLIGTGTIAAAELGSNRAINAYSRNLGAGLFMGFSLKFGADIESPANASHVPMEDEGGFFKRTFGGIFKKKDKQDSATPADKGKSPN